MPRTVQAADGREDLLSAGVRGGPRVAEAAVIQAAGGTILMFPVSFWVEDSRGGVTNSVTPPKKIRKK